MKGVTMLNSILSFFPILLTIVALMFRMKALHAAFLGVMATLVGILVAFPLSTEQMELATLHWGPVLAEVVAIIGGGLLLSHILQHDGGQGALAIWLEERTGAGIGSILLIVHGITPFAESVTGFGIGITVAIPLLRHLGLSAPKVAVLGLLGLCAVPWGSIGPGTLIAAAMSGVSFYRLGIISAVVSSVPFMLTGVAAGFLGGMAEHRCRNVLYGLLSGAVLAGIITVMNMIFGTAPAGALGALVMICLFLLLPGRKGLVPSLSRAGWKALSSYAVLLAGVLLTGWTVDHLGLAAGWQYLASPAVWLFIAACFAAGGLPDGLSLQKSWKAWKTSASVTGLFLIMGVLMSTAGMAACLSKTLAHLGPFYVVMAPVISALGGFVTGSNSGANAMFAATQADIARSLHLNVLWFMGIQNVVSSFLLMASPGKVEMAVQLVADENGVGRWWIQRTILYVSASVILSFMGLSCFFIR